MSRTIRAPFLVPLALIALAPLACFAQNAAFNLPAQPLAESLRAVGAQTGLNIMVSPPLVDGKQAPALKANLSVKDALVRLLAGTTLEYHFVNDQTVVIREKSQAVAVSDPPAAQPGDASGQNSKEAGKNSSQDFRMAQVDQASAGPQAVEEKKEEKRVELQEVVVTGTHIRGTEPVTPITVVDQSYIQHSGYTTLGDVIRSLPESFGGGQNPTVVGATGAGNENNVGATSSPNLRGLGSDATLTLVNGHRIVLSGFQNSSDISVIPLAAVDHVEVLKDGASAVYGADAVGGVVNFVLKDKFDGVETGASLSDPTGSGGFQQHYNLLGGASWTGGGGLLSYEYSDQQPLNSTDRSFTASNSDPGTFLEPGILQNSIFGTIHHAINDSLSIYAQGLYTEKNITQVGTDPDVFVGHVSTHDSQYNATAGLTYAITNAWLLTASGTIGSDTLDSTEIDFLPPSPAPSTPAIADYVNKAWAGEVSVDGPLFTLPSGDVETALGGGFRREKYTDSTTLAKRDVSYVFAETQIPLVSNDINRIGLEKLRLSVAGRYENYSSIGSSVVPKFGVLYQPIDELVTRATWGKSFKVPSLVDQFGQQQAYLFPLPDSSPSGTTTSLIAAGGNPDLQPEKSTSWTLGGDYGPTWLTGVKVGVTYFNINFRNKIDQPIPGIFTSLTNPLYSPFIMRNPSAALQQSIISNAAFFVNATGQPYDPSAVGALVQDEFQNFFVQDLHGVDVALQYSAATALGRIDVGASATKLKYSQQFLPGTPFTEVSGTVFNPPNWKGRLSLTWTQNSWSATASENYIGSENDPSTVPVTPISSWSTTDLQVSYSTASARVSPLLRQARISLSVLNALNREPPSIPATTPTYPGIRYDSANANPLGRVVVLQIVKDW